MKRGLELRLARPGDEPAVAAVHVRSWQIGYSGLLPASYLDGLRPEDRAGSYTFAEQNSDSPATVVAVEDDRIVGFVTFGPARNRSMWSGGELYALYVDPARWGHGVGRALVVTARERLAGRGLTEAALWVLDGSTRAERFYERDGWRRDGSRHRESVHGIDVEGVWYRRSLP
jgi:GNAT superfamily N-acetyltransferase